MPFKDNQTVYRVDGVTVKEARVAKDTGANTGFFIYTPDRGTVGANRGDYFASEREALEARIAVLQERVNEGEGTALLLADLQAQLTAINHPPTTQEGQ